MEHTVESSRTIKATSVLCWDYSALLPIVTFLGSSWAFAPPEQFSLRNLLLPLALLIGGWMPLWNAVLHTHWHQPLQAWYTWHTQVALPHWPYLQPHTPGTALHQRLAQALHWWQTLGQRALAAPLRRAILALGVSTLISSALGSQSVMLSLLYITWTELAVLWHAGKGESVPGWSVLTAVGLPYLLGSTLYGESITFPAISAITLTLVVGIYAQTSFFAMVGPLLGASFLLWHNHPLAAGSLLLFALPKLFPSSNEQAMRPVTNLWIVAMVCVFIGAL